MGKRKVFIQYIYIHNFDVLFHIFCVFDTLFKQHMDIYRGDESITGDYVRDNEECL